MGNLATVATITASQPASITLRPNAWRGWIPSIMERPDRFARIGGTGSGRQLLGKASPESRVRLMFGATSKVVALQIARDLERLQGYAATFVDPYGRSLVAWIDRAEVSPPSGTRGATIAGVAVVYRIEATLTVEAIETP